MKRLGEGGRENPDPGKGTEEYLSSLTEFYLSLNFYDRVINLLEIWEMLTNY